MFKPVLFRAAAALLFASATSSHAALLWQADFSTYSDGQAITTNNTTGANNTFSRITGTGITVTLTGRSEAPPFSTGVYADFDATAATTGSSGTMGRRNLAAFGDGDVRIVSFDVARTSAGSLNLRIDFIDSGYLSLGSGNTTFSNLAIPAADTLYRVTAVYNQSGSSIALPGSLSPLADGFAAFYYKVGGVYTQVGSSLALGTNTGAGFQLSMTGLAVGESVMFDNMGFWSSASDTVGGVNVLELGAVPEPSSSLYFLGALALVWRRRFRK